MFCCCSRYDFFLTLLAEDLSRRKIAFSITDANMYALCRKRSQRCLRIIQRGHSRSAQEWRAKRVVGELWDEGLASGRCDDGLSQLLTSNAKQGAALKGK